MEVCGTSWTYNPAAVSKVSSDGAGGNAISGASSGGECVQFGLRLWFFSPEIFIVEIRLGLIREMHRDNLHYASGSEPMNNLQSVYRRC